MPRPIWKGAISFGMVTIPIRLYTATEEKDVRFNLLHRTDKARIKQKRFCAVEDVELQSEDVVRGYDIGGGQYVLIDDEDFDNVPINTTRTIEITEFVKLEQIDPVFYQKTYYLEPEEVGMKPFTLLMRALEDSGRVAIAKVSMRQKEQLCSLRVYNNTIALETMFYADEVRSPEELNIPGEDIKISDRELAMANMLIESLAGDFDYETYKDEYRDALLEVIRQKAAGETVVAPQPAVAQVTDLMEALRASVEAAQQKKTAAAAQPAEAEPEDLGERRRRRKAG